MSINGLIDVHVLEETASRVAGLTRSINKQVSLVEEVSLNACKALTPADQQYRNLGHFRENAPAVLKEYERIEHAARQINTVEEQIGKGPAKVDWQKYITAVAKARSLSAEFSQDPNLKRFPHLSESAEKQYRLGVNKLQKYVSLLSLAVFVPLDGKQFLGSEEPMPQFIPEDISALSKLVYSLHDFLGVPQEATDESLISAMGAFMENSLKPALEEISARPSPEGVQAYELLCNEVKSVLENGFHPLFGSDSQRLQKFKEIANQLALNEKCKAPSHFNSSKRSSGPIGASSPRSPGKAPFGSPGPASPQQGSQRPKPKTVEALQGPRIPTDRDGGAGSPGVLGRSPQAHPQLSITTPTAATNSPSGGPGTPIATASPATSGSTGIGSLAGSSGFSWGSFEVIESSRRDPIAADDLAKSKREALATLMQVFVDIEAQCRKSPITSEFGVSGASLQFMKVLTNISSAGHGLEVVLSEVPTRGYLAKPQPDWALKSEPTPAARANPVSLYYSDCLTCLYASLHQVASDQLDDVKKTGIFMLSNLVAIEHFITGSKSDTMNSVKPRTELMNNMGDVALQKFEKLMELSFKEYLSDWSKLAPHLMESTITGNATNAKLSSKDREVVKEKFKQFNSEFENLVERQKRYQISDPSLRMRMGQEVKKLIGPLYVRFYLKHKDGDFTKNISKYVKYTPSQIDEYVMLK